MLRIGRPVAFAIIVGLIGQVAGDAVSADLSTVEALKDRQQGLVEAVLRRQPAAADAKSIRLELDRSGADVGYEVRMIAGATPRIGVTVRLSVDCASDNLLMLFERQAEAWAPVMIRRSPPYSTLAGAWEELEYDLSEPDAAGRWFL